jgi:hypothetical protein
MTSSARVNVEGLVAGVGLVALGVVFTLGNFGRIDALATLHRVWPLLLVVWGGLELALAAAQRRGQRRRRR